MKILITGPESSGKTSLAEALCKVYGGKIRTEYARVYLEENGSDYAVGDLVKIWEQQIAIEKTLDEENNFLLCDTAHFIIAVWNEVRFKSERLSMENLVEDLGLDYAHVLLCAPDIDWVPDPLREHPDQTDRQRLFERYRELIEEWRLPYTIISGENRLELALKAITKFRPEYYRQIPGD